ncbi:ribosomal protein S18 acetylase RimI-like enzyme [Arthrobacter pascens]|uniref:GNAT family N-acetyltransferase n=1 Tax=Arthrobacter pascens TaxID=1677 RepID=UPI00278EC970|nr:GNAT family N-acetyltransferase [Arthrobacter pascens]MDQ0677167.1 ribosomal protein S18 acetylase RimI-like enzyme [Arthrobacter pascens]
MAIADDPVSVVADHGVAGVRESAAIWVHAKAYRDRNSNPATVEETMPGIRSRLDLDGAVLLLAQRSGSSVGFILFAPRERTLEIFYLGVAPEMWGRGIGRRLLLSAEDHARKIGQQALELWVINDNDRAIHVYERSGFVATEELKRDVKSGRLERRFLRPLS